MKRIILLIGLPSSGKSTLAKKLVAKGFTSLCADDIRAEIYGEAIIQGDPQEVFKIFFERLDGELAAGNNLVVDNTNLNPKHREPILAKARAANYDDIQLWMLDTPLAVCLKRNSERARVVPNTVIENYHTELHRSRPKKSEGKVMIIKPAAEDNEFLFFPQN